MERASYKRFFASVIAGTMLFSFGALMHPKQAHALTDVLNLVQNTITAVHAPLTTLATAATAASTNSLSIKEYALDPIANIAAKIALQSITKSTVNWINSGFNGSPAFVTDLSTRMQNIGDTVAVGFINQLASNAAISSPFQNLIANSLKNAYFSSTGRNGFFTQNAFTLNQFSANPAAFLQGGQGFDQGGFNAFFAAGQPQNNPFGAYLLSESALNAAVASKQADDKTTLQWGSGFASYTGNCTAAASSALTKPATNPDGSIAVSFNTSPVALSNTNTTCVGQPIKTPGALLNSMTAKALGIPADQLNAADEFNEIVGALFSQLVSKTLNGGLSALSDKSSGGGTSIIDQATDASQLTATATGIGAAASLGATIDNQRSVVATYQSNWQVIQAAAAAAQTCSASKAQTVLDQAATAITKATNALGAIDKIRAEITSIEQSAPTTDQTVVVQNVSNEYQQLLAASTTNALPTIEEVNQAAYDSADSGSNATTSLYTQMTQVAQTCAAKT